MEPEDKAEQLLDKLRDFVESLDEEERELLAALLAPGVAQAYQDAEVTGFAAPTESPWQASRLPDALAARIRAGRLRIEMD